MSYIQSYIFNSMLDLNVLLKKKNDRFKNKRKKNGERGEIEVVSIWFHFYIKRKKNKPMVILIGFQFYRFGVCLVLNVHVRSNKICKRAKSSFSCSKRCVYDLFLQKIGSSVSYCIALVLVVVIGREGKKKFAFLGVRKSHKPNAILHGAASLYAKRGSQTIQKCLNSLLDFFFFGFFLLNFQNPKAIRVCIVCTKASRHWYDYNKSIHITGPHDVIVIHRSIVRWFVYKMGNSVRAGIPFHIQRNVHKLFLAGDFFFLFLLFFSI